MRGEQNFPTLVTKIVHVAVKYKNPFLSQHAGNSRVILLKTSTARNTRVKRKPDVLHVTA